VKNVFVGLSGGVDSAVAAYLLKKEGYAVTGVFIRGWEPDFLPCTGADDRLSAMRVAAHLEIPFHTYDLSEEYKKSVVDYFVSEYRAGRTPNPDVMCNRTIKFGAMWDRAKKDGADYIATGHYAMTNGEELLVSKDEDKDQAYFLWTLTKDDLAHTLFPIGKYRKGEVRKIAEKAKLPNFARKDSQGLCFLGHVDMHDFLKRYVPTEKGVVRNTDGDVVGEHDGAWFYTLGQRHGISVASDERVYIVEKDVKKNELVVSADRAQGEGKSVYDLTSVSWVSGVTPTGEVLAQYRYHGPMVRAVVKGSRIKFEEAVLVAPGQSVVVYSKDKTVCYGGGIIV